MFKILNFKIKVFLTKLRYGSHSLEYVNLFKKNDLRSPFAPCVKDEFVFHIMMYLKKNENVKVYKTKEPIQFGNFSFNTSYKDFYKQKGVPSCFNALIFNKHEINILGYSDFLLNKKIKSIYYFADNHFILGEYVFAESSLNASFDITKMLVEKYTDEKAEKIDEFFISGEDRNCIYFINNGFEISIKYFNYSDDFSKNFYEKAKKEIFPETEDINSAKNKLNEML